MRTIFILGLFLLSLANALDAQTKTINGSTGTDTLNINYSGITSLKDFTLTSSGSDIIFTDANSGSITFTDIESVVVNSITYAFNPTGAINSGDGGLSNALYSTSQGTIHSYGATVWYAQNICSGSNSLGFNCSDDIEYVGSEYQETLNLNVDRATGYTGDFTIDLKAGNDSILSAKLINTDSINLGAGDDSISIMATGSNGTPAIGSLSLALLDGGDGTDTLSFEESTPADGTTLSLATGGATNFENLTGGSNAETLNGDTGNNILSGKGGADTLNGNDGNDTLYADSYAGGVENCGSIDTDDALYGNAGNDELVGNIGDNTLDGGTGADSLKGCNGVDVFVIRSGDGGASIELADTVLDFADGVDGIGLVSPLTFGDLTISASGSDTIIAEGSEYLMKLASIAASDITYLDFLSSATSAITLTGTSGDDVLLGGSGGDTFNGGNGSDTMLGWGGNDTFNIRSKTGSYTDNIKGGAGTDTLNINYSGITSLKDFTLTSSGSDIIFTDANSGSITFTDIESVVVNSITYAFNPTGAINSGDGGLSNALYSTSQGTIHSYGATVWYAQNICSGSNSLGFNCSDDIEYVGSEYQETLNLNVDRATGYTGDFTIDLKAGNDSILSAKLINTDSINLGAGDDSISIMATGSNGTPAIGSLSLALLDGGDGTDTLSFEESTPADGTTLSLATGGATNFENLTGGSNAETLNGDTGNNILSGKGGADTLNGNDGNDTLYADSYAGGVENCGSIDTDDALYGNAGNDELVGNIGDNTLDGGTGADSLKGCNGVDVFVIRSGDGGASIELADTVLDFADGVDGIGLVSPLTFGDLTISASGSDTIIAEGSEYLMKLASIAASDITYLDFLSSATSAITLTGTSGDDVLLGGSGGDTFNGGNGSDTMLGWGGNDTFNIRSKTGSYTDNIKGGAGTDTLNINYSGITSLKDFTLTSSGSDIIFTDANSGSITFTDIESVVVNSITYAFNPTGAINSGDGGLSNALYSTSQGTIHSYGATVWYAQNICSGSNSLGFNCSDDIEYVGSEYQETLNLNVDRATGYTGDFTIDLKAGNDSILSAKLINTDSINLGAGDDSISIMATGSNGTPAIGSLSLALLDGGDGTDTLSFEESTPADGTTLSLATGGATNFENLTGGSNAETLNGDTGNNILSGKGGADTLNGNDGNDTLYADSYAGGVENCGSIDTDDALYGNAGNDELVGNIGDNTLDGGTGADSLKGCNGVDVFVIRSGDGGASIELADTVLDFADGEDLIGMSGLNFSELRLEQGSGDYINHVVVKKKDTGEFLIIIQNISLNSISDIDFTAIEI